MPIRHISTLLLVLSALALSACTTKDIRYASEQIEPSVRIKSRYETVEVVEVTLPVYAASEQIFTQGADGAITELGPLWADNPARAITLQLARDMAAITGAMVVPEPWPFRGRAEARVDVRIEELLATSNGAFRISGQFFVAPENAKADRSDQFSISVSLPANPTPSQIASARSAATSQLAEKIAMRGLK
jgi:hypothetical protein